MEHNVDVIALLIIAFMSAPTLALLISYVLVIAASDTVSPAKDVKLERRL